MRYHARCIRGVLLSEGVAVPFGARRKDKTKPALRHLAPRERMKSKPSRLAYRLLFSQRAVRRRLRFFAKSCCFRLRLRLGRIYRLLILRRTSKPQLLPCFLPILVRASVRTTVLFPKMERKRANLLFRHLDVHSLPRKSKYLIRKPSVKRKSATARSSLELNDGGSNFRDTRTRRVGRAAGVSGRVSNKWRPAA